MQPTESLYIVTGLGSDVFIWATTAAEVRTRLHALRSSPSRPDSGLRPQDDDESAPTAFVSDILDLLADRIPAPPPSVPEHLSEPLSEGELRVLRYLPSSLSAPEIGAELSLSLNTVKTHLRHIYAKLGVHHRIEAVDRAREVGLLRSSSSRHHEGNHFLLEREPHAATVLPGHRLTRFGPTSAHTDS